VEQQSENNDDAGGAAASWPRKVTSQSQEAGVNAPILKELSMSVDRAGLVELHEHMVLPSVWKHRNTVAE
jgi:hypothetical protein